MADPRAGGGPRDAWPGRLSATRVQAHDPPLTGRHRGGRPRSMATEVPSFVMQGRRLNPSRPQRRLARPSVVPPAPSGMRRCCMLSVPRRPGRCPPNAGVQLACLPMQAASMGRAESPCAVAQAMRHLSPRHGADAARSPGRHDRHRGRSARRTLQARAAPSGATGPWTSPGRTATLALERRCAEDLSL